MRVTRDASGVTIENLQMFNSLEKDPTQVLPRGKTVYFLDWTRTQGKQLEQEDWMHKNHHLEKCLSSIENPVYLVWYKTADGDLPGLLIFEAFGLIFYELGPPETVLHTTSNYLFGEDCHPIMRAGPIFRATYADIHVDDSNLIPIPDSEIVSGEPRINYHFQISLFNSGARRDMQNERLSFMRSFSEDNITLLSVVFRLQERWITGDYISNIDRLEIAESFKRNLTKFKIGNSDRLVTAEIISMFGSSAFTTKRTSNVLLRFTGVASFRGDTGGIRLSAVQERQMEEDGAADDEQGRALVCLEFDDPPEVLFSENYAEDDRARAVTEGVLDQENYPEDTGDSPCFTKKGFKGGLTDQIHAIGVSTRNSEVGTSAPSMAAGLTTTPSLQPAPGEELTYVRYFDIAYEDIFPDLEQQAQSKVEFVSERLHILKDLFGYRKLGSVFDISNQSFFSLNKCFPELNRRISSKEIVGKEGYHSYLLYQGGRILQEPSRIIRETDAKLVGL